MGYIIDVIHVMRKVTIFTFIIISSPMTIIAALLLLDTSSL